MSLNFTPNTSCGPCLYCGRSSEGRPEELLACELCRRPLHMACLPHGLPRTTLLGDNLFRATCSVCAVDGRERVVRPVLSYVHILLLIMYNLHKQQEESSRAGFFHTKIHILRFLTEHWKELESPDTQRKRKKMIQNAVSSQLAHYSRFFVSGQSVLDVGGWYRLARVLPPALALLGGGSGLEGKESELENAPGKMENTSTQQPLSTIGIKSEPKDTEEWSYPDPSTSSWFTEKDILTPHSLPPKALFEGEERAEEEEEEDDEDEEDELWRKGGGSDCENQYRVSLAMKEEIIVKEELTFEGFEDETQKTEEEEAGRKEEEAGRMEEEEGRKEAEEEGRNEAEEEAEEECDVEGDIQEEAPVNIKTEGREEEDEGGGGGGGGETELPPVCLSLFPSSSSTSSPSSSSSSFTAVPPVFLLPGIHSPTKLSKNLRRMSRYEERVLLRELERKVASAAASSRPLPPHLYRLRRKLAVRRQKAEHGLPLFNLDEEVEFLRRNGRVMTKRDRMAQQGTGGAGIQQHHSSAFTARILDRFQVAKQHRRHLEEHNISFATRLGGSDAPPTLIHSPYTLRRLKPYILRDYNSTPLRLQLLQEIVSHYHRGDAEWQPPPPHPIDYCYVTPRHIPAMNQLARHFFWPGIDLSEVLQYPDHTCVVLYRHLVVGFGVLVPDTSYNEAYLSFLLVHPEWRRAGIATFILYHLIQTCQGKDVTLHVSATNPALILYQRFGFKVEEFLSNFYDKYLPDDSPECKHAMFMRLSR